jgi:hypothetical protein
MAPPVSAPPFFRLGNSLWASQNRRYPPKPNKFHLPFCAKGPANLRWWCCATFRFATLACSTAVAGAVSVAGTSALACASGTSARDSGLAASGAGATAGTEVRSGDSSVVGRGGMAAVAWPVVTTRCIRNGRAGAVGDDFVVVLVAGDDIIGRWVPLSCVHSASMTCG